MVVNTSGYYRTKLCQSYGDNNINHKQPYESISRDDALPYECREQSPHVIYSIHLVFPQLGGDRKKVGEKDKGETGPAIKKAWETGSHELLGMIMVWVVLQEERMAVVIGAVER